MFLLLEKYAISLLNVRISVGLFMTLVYLKQFICWKILCLKIVSIYKNVFHVRLLALHNKSEKRKTLKKELSEELMLLMRHPLRWWDWCLSEDEKKRMEPIFTDKVGK